ncbi:MAG TPA: polysaccharide deacetylase family protein [Usitatibacter sp.]|nr:polysaccharide deacetylase family protein [Usitatibacter sp.]
MSARVAPAPPERWRPTPLVASSLGLHCVAGASALLGPEAWPWAAIAVAANHMVLGAVCMWPRSTMLGPNITQLPDPAIARREIAFTFDDGPDPDVTPRVLDILDAHGVRASFFCIAEHAARHPELCREIARRGHAVENHSRTHLLNFALRGPGGTRREVSAAQSELSAITGRRPRFFRAPAGIRSPFLDPVLHDLGLKLVSWTRRGFDTRRSDADEIASLLVAGMAAGDILLMHDGNCARMANGTPVVLDVLPRVIHQAQTLGLRPVTLEHAIAA